MGLAADGEWSFDAASLVQQLCPIPVHDGEVVPRTPCPVVLNIECSELYLDDFSFCDLDNIDLVERVVVVAASVAVAVS